VKDRARLVVASLNAHCDLDAARALRREVPAPVLVLILRVGGRDYNRRIASTWA
jgi:hypothetical protein